MSEAEKLQRIRARLAAITPGEWLPVLGSGMNQCTVIASDVSTPNHEGGDSERATFICDLLPDYVLKGVSGFIVPKDHIPNLKFIEHAPDDIAYLLAIIDSLVETWFRALR